ncbi:hypothetical protein LJ707_13265 [Mucilaginibacter sp. UR6-1]|uniref:hypothetical protein n=1 Tax=Mucilaginibacter sp. UR6-1 TaxID=1435643 RepID=UPI001E459C52|nr:hypothetical protein [Mucilaginibacter sp. UR6-1]MCC8409901.1 hypothetical protein [Mucilaginibacter sp. UR6-1]
MNSDEHCRNPQLIKELLKNDFKNERYEITFTQLSPNVVKGKFVNKFDKEVYESNFGLPNTYNGEKIKAETHINLQPLVFWGFDKGSNVPYIPDFEINSDDFVDFLNNKLISVQDNRGIDKLNNPKPDNNIKHINDIKYN